MERLDIDGVPVVWHEAPGPLTASLVFRVGRRDETFVTGGITHLVEHLTMAALPRTHLDCNASVDIASTTFTATGRPGWPASRSPRSVTSPRRRSATSRRDSSCAATRCSL